MEGSHQALVLLTLLTYIDLFEKALRRECLPTIVHGPKRTLAIGHVLGDKESPISPADVTLVLEVQYYDPGKIKIGQIYPWCEDPDRETDAYSVKTLPTIPNLDKWGRQFMSAKYCNFPRVPEFVIDEFLSKYCDITPSLPMVRSVAVHPSNKTCIDSRSKNLQTLPYASRA